MPANANDTTPSDFYDDPANSLGYLARIVHRAFYRQLERRTLAAGVSSGQWPFLRALWTVEGMSQRELSLRVGMQEPTTVAALNTLEKSGLVRREPSKADRRKIHVFLTDKGRDLREDMMARVAQVNAIATRGIDPAEMALVRAHLTRIAENLADDDMVGDRASAA
jgi:DNA-binding MarR family transcriptional regulator